MNLEERKKFAKLNSAWLEGEKIDGLLFRHNSTVRVTLADGTSMIGWIVAASFDGPEPIYTVEAEDGSGDIECLESAIKEDVKSDSSKISF
jgi:hypothetical protein